MPNRFTPDELTSLPQMISAPRYGTYSRACGNDAVAALRLYHWNAQTSACFLFPLHIFEICIRNAAATAIERYYGADWPWSVAFRTSLPDPIRPHFSPSREIEQVASRHSTAGKVIADLKFAFWVSLYTSRHDGRLWNSNLHREFPHLPTGATVRTARNTIHTAADRLRELRNRIAHHEPIFKRDLIKDYTVILETVTYRCTHSASWMNRSQQVSNLLTLRPPHT
jgi:hypothetical protein